MLYLQSRICLKNKSSLIFVFLITTLLNAKEQLRIDKFNWKIAETKHFEVYYYEGEEKKLDEVIFYLEEAYKKVTEKLKYEPQYKTPFFLYKNHLEFEQNRIALIGEETGGFSEPFKNRFVIPLFTSEEELEHVIAHEFAHIVSFYLWYGGRWRSLSLARLWVYPIPLWIAEGIAEYTSDVWDSLDDMIIRDAYLNNKIIPVDKMTAFSHLEGYQVWLAYKQSQFIFKFIEDKYGKDKILEILNEANKGFDSSNILYKTVKKDVFEFDREFRNYLKTKYDDFKSKTSPYKYGSLISPNIPYSYFGSPLILKDKIYFIGDNYGYDEIFCFNKKTKKLKKLMGRKFYSDFEFLYKKENSLTLDKTGLWFAASKKRRNYLIHYNFKKKKIDRKIKVPFDTIDAINYYQENYLIINASKDGFQDLYIYDFDKKIYKNLTNDTDREYSFCVHGDTIVGTSERNKQKDLFVLNLNTKNKIYLTNTEKRINNNETDPFVYNGKLYFVADYNGIYNLYSAKFSTKTLKEINQLTDIQTGIFKPFILDNKIVFQSYCKGSYRIFYGNLNDFKDNKIVINQNYKLAKEKKMERLPYTTKPFRFRFTTDLFYPLIAFYFDENGMEFYTLTYWQASDYLSRNKLAFQIIYLTPYQQFQYQLSYIYQPRFFDLNFDVIGERDTEFGIIDDEERITKQINLTGARLSFNFPLSKYNSIDLALSSLRERNSDYFEETNKIEYKNIISLYYNIDTKVQRYLYPSKGTLMSIGLEKSSKELRSDKEYITYSLFYKKYFKLFKGEKHFLNFSLEHYISEGEDYLNFNSSIKGYNEDKETGKKFLKFSLNYQFNFIPNINYNLWWLVPPLYFKSLSPYISFYYGSSYEEKPQFLSSLGVGFKIYTFLFEQFPIIFNFEWVKGLQFEKETKFYFFLGSL